MFKKTAVSTDFWTKMADLANDYPPDDDDLFDPEGSDSESDFGDSPSLNEDGEQGKGPTDFGDSGDPASTGEDLAKEAISAVDDRIRAAADTRRR